MPGWYGDAPGRRVGWAVLGAIAVAVTVLVTTLPLLLPAAEDIPVVVDEATATCEEPQSGRPRIVVRSGTLLACPDVFDQRVVTVQGEAIGDLFDGPHGRRWVQVNDDAYARVGPLDSHRRLLGTNSGMAVLLPTGTDPSSLGGPGRRGDLVRVTGVFQAASPADQGGPAVIADSVEPLREGGPIDRAPAPGLRVAAPVAVVITLALLGGVVMKRRARTRR